MDPSVHKRFLDYREAFTYFGRGGVQCLDAATFEAADAEHRALLTRGNARDDDEEARFRALTSLLYRD